MGNLITYLEWRGDLTFKQSPFNEVDNLILSQFTYVNLDDIAPGPNKKEWISIKDANEEYFSRHSEQELQQNKSFTKSAPLLMKQMARSKRFQDAKISNYVNQIDINKQKQFAAMHVKINDKSTYIAFRGTDDTIVGWKEDFNMSFTTVPSQNEALLYLEKTVKGIFGKYRVGGHSKGGNLAIYAATKSSAKVKRHIIGIYNNDGPGFTEEVATNSSYEEMLDKINTIVPEFSVIGRLLEHGGDYIVVKSSQKGILQHDAMSWEVLGNQFVREKELAKESVLLERTIKAWLKEMNVEQKKQFIESLFMVIEATGADTLTDLSKGGIKNLNIIAKSFNSIDTKTKEKIIKLIKLLSSGYNKEFVQPLFKKIDVRVDKLKKNAFTSGGK